MNKLFLLFFLSLICFACGNDPQTDETTAPTTTVISPPAKPATTKLTANIDHLRLRAEAGTSGETVTMLQKGDVMYDLGEVSDFTTKVELRGVKYDEPWLKVKTADGQTGWVYAGGVYFDPTEASDLIDQILRKRLASFYGEATAKEIADYQNAYARARSDREFAAALRKADKVITEINKASENSTLGVHILDSDKKPDIRWLRQSFPGYRLGSAAEGTILYLYRDFKQMQDKAGQTKGKADDDYLNLEMLVHAADSIEYFYPSYFMQTWDYGGFSLLGEGKHLAILEKANETMAKHPGIFDTEINKIKDDLVHDMTAAPEGYWYEKSRILSEFDKIMKAELGILTKKDKIALSAQRNRLENPAANNIKVGMRSGISS